MLCECNGLNGLYFVKPLDRNRILFTSLLVLIELLRTGKTEKQLEIRCTYTLKGFFGKTKPPAFPGDGDQFGVHASRDP